MTTTVNFLKVRNNVDFRYVVSLTDGEDALDITTASFFMQVVPKLGTATVVLDLSLGDGLELFTDGTDGKLVINVDHLVMVDIPVGNYKYDLVMVRGALSEVVIEGTMKIRAGVTEL